MQKLAQFVEQANLPAEVYERIRREVMWFTLPAEIKHAQLLSQGQSTPQDFARLVQYVQEAMGEGRISEAIDIAQHYFSAWEKAPSAVRAEEMKRAPELLRALASVQTLPLMHTLAEVLRREIQDETRLHWPCHLEAAHCLAVVAQNAGRFEDFDFVHKIASDLKGSHEPVSRASTRTAVVRPWPGSLLRKRWKGSSSRFYKGVATQPGCAPPLHCWP